MSGLFGMQKQKTMPAVAAEPSAMPAAVPKGGLLKKKPFAKPAQATSVGSLMKRLTGK